MTMPITRENLHKDIELTLSATVRQDHIVEAAATRYEEALTGQARLASRLRENMALLKELSR